VNARDANRLLTAISVADYRFNPGDLDIAFWAEELGDIHLDVAIEAVKRHYRESTDRIMPAHVVAFARSRRRKPDDGHVGVLTGAPSWERTEEMQEVVSKNAALCRSAIRAHRSTTGERKDDADEREPEAATIPARD